MEEEETTEVVESLAGVGVIVIAMEEILEEVEGETETDLVVVMVVAAEVAEEVTSVDEAEAEEEGAEEDVDFLDHLPQKRCPILSLRQLHNISASTNTVLMLPPRIQTQSTQEEEKVNFLTLVCSTKVKDYLPEMECHPKTLKISDVLFFLKDRSSTLPVNYHSWKNCHTLLLESLEGMLLTHPKTKFQ